ncbi:TolB family protein [Alkalitalea saponilacus]|uniref:WD40-like Beta Propeller Repeat n=1 Tax=Alkalitalea saponilacus TaxID=889453 RepID=A0A1T5HF98_9BACT|nr:PD40 domain-containing protein [Alkalitalea saponilacus]SKC19201.1 WD40-like Beta Propeller Repeat [Alkalitalea saponilacus]
MKNVLTIIFFTIFIGLTSSCEKSNNEYKYNEGRLPRTPVNLSDFNTEHDDFNMTAPTLGELIPFCFSSNRNSNGDEFDIIFKPMDISFDRTTEILTIKNEYGVWGSYEEYFEVIKDGLNKIKTSGNELGPNLIIEHNSNKMNFILLYSTDITGNSKINYISNKNNTEFSDPREVMFLNSGNDNMYPTFNSDKSRIYFCSNRDGNSFNIYYVDVNAETDIESLLSDDSPYEVFLEESLSSLSDDKCPYIFDNKIVFASNREGGNGGFDLYYSLWENNQWSDPVNFGSTINSEYDEFRPIVFDERVSETQSMMIFSSNRPGGLGGFDLYFVGIE